MPGKTLEQHSHTFRDVPKESEMLIKLHIKR